MTSASLVENTVEPEPEGEQPQHPPHFWPEAVREEPRLDSFPWLTLIKGLLPGLIAVVLLASLLIFLMSRAGRQIVFAGTDGSVRAVRADGSRLREVYDPPLQLSAESRNQYLSDLPLLALPVWSPDGQQLAATIATDDGVQAMIFSPLSGTTTLLSSAMVRGNRLVVPVDAWSPAGTHLALVETDGQQPFITLAALDNEEPTMLPVSVELDVHAGLSWHPDGSRLLVTAVEFEEDIVRPALRFINTDGTVQTFRPSTGGLQQTDGVWSPDGTAVAYIVPDREIEGQPGLLGGALWIAAANGANARQLVRDGLNLAPIWDRADPGHIYFTRYSAEDERFGLYRVNNAGTLRVEYVGDSNEALVDYPFDRQRFIRRPMRGQLLTIADAPSVATNQQGWTPDTVVRMLLGHSLPLLGFPQWSPTGRHLAATTWQNGKILPLLLTRNLQPQAVPNSSLDVMAVPADGWSADGEVLAFVEYDGERPLLTLYPVNGGQPAPFQFTLDRRAGISWHPVNQEILVTGYESDSADPTLFIAGADGQVRELSANDGNLVHADGVWSPDGTRIAYIASNTYTATQDMLAGSLWVVNSDGTLTSQLAEHLALAPMWDPLGDMIYYTHFDMASGRFEHYRVRANGTSQPEYIGPGSALPILYPWDRQLFSTWSPDGKKLLFMAADPQLPPAFLEQRLNTITIEQVRDGLPLMGASRWSPDGQRFAGTVVDNGVIRVAVFSSTFGPSSLSPESSDWFVMPGDGWSPDGTNLALVRYDGMSARIAVLNTIQNSLGTASFDLDRRAGLSWHPNGTEVLVTALDEGITPTLQIYNVNSNTTRGLDQEDEIIRADGVWSPDGQYVAYVAPPSITSTQMMTFLAGSLWIANQDGTEPRELVAEGLNFAPVWDLERQQILFSRYLTETDTFDLYQIDLAGENLERLGPSSSAFAEFPFDRQLLHEWLPDGRRGPLPSANVQRPSSFFQAEVTETGLSVAPLPYQCETAGAPVGRWAPTNRAILIACPTAQMFLHWIGSERDNTIFPAGLYPTWQP